MSILDIFYNSDFDIDRTDDFIEENLQEIFNLDGFQNLYVMKF